MTAPISGLYQYDSALAQVSRSAPPLSSPGQSAPGKAALAERMPRLAPLLMDDRADPPLRDLIGGLLARATTADFAISRMRLDGLDLGGGELGGIQRCRVLMGRLDARALDELMGGNNPGSARLHHLQALREFLASGRVEIRAAGVVAWNPDFSILDGLRDAPASAIALVGAHYFLRPYPIEGVALTMMIRAPTAIGRLRARFDELWEEGYDVGEVVRAALDHLEVELTGSKLEDDALALR